MLAETNINNKQASTPEKRKLEDELVEEAKKIKVEE